MRNNVSIQLLVRFAVIGGISIFLSACASKPPALLIPIEAAPENADVIGLLAITTRARSELPGEVFTGARGEDISAAIVKVSVPPSHQPGRLEWPSGANPDPKEDFAALAVDIVSQEESWDWFKNQDTQGRLLIFVHGYNVDFADAVFRLAQITEDLSVDTAPILFSWPSKGELLGYYYDRESANFSRDAFEAVIAEAVASENVLEITILAHSMGSWITMETLRQMNIRNGELSPKIRDVILAAPDLDIDVFNQQFSSLSEQRPHFTFLVSADDRALGLSKLLARGVQRLGAIDPSQEPYRSQIEATPGITVVDLSNLKGGGSTRHTKFAETGETLKLARETLADNEARTGARTSIGEHAGAVIVTLGQNVADLSK